MADLILIAVKKINKLTGRKEKSNFNFNKRLPAWRKLNL
jgi:hypothetical protein